MAWLTIRSVNTGEGRPLRGTVAVPGDKSISHRALMLGAIGEGDAHIEGFLPSGDCLATMNCIRRLGIGVEELGSGASTSIMVRGRGLRGLRAPVVPLDCGRSGTTMRLLAGILSGQDFDSVLTGDPQLLRRPMSRIGEPLRRMGAAIQETDGHAPLIIKGRKRLRGGEHVLAVASAQVKSAILLAGLYADGPVTVLQPGPARDHTERMLAAQIETKEPGRHPIVQDGETVTLDPRTVGRLGPGDRVIPGDLSSAAFLLAAATLCPDSQVTLSGVGVNPTRTGFLEVLAEMGGEVRRARERVEGGEPVADLIVRGRSLLGTTVGGAMVVRMIDEFPVLAVLATQAEGETTVRDAAELRVKETDRITTVVEELSKLGARISPWADGFVVEGPTELEGAEVDSHGDHRLGMALTVAGLVARGETRVLGAECIPDSFPGFVEALRSLGADIRHGG